jgi:hypothetical protein
VKTKLKILLTASEVCHILSLIACNERNGEHTAPQDQYWKRSERIKAKLSKAAPLCSAVHPALARTWWLKRLNKYDTTSYENKNATNDKNV